ETAYSRAFPDRWLPEVLFVTRIEARRDLIEAVIEQRKHSGKYEAAGRALTLREAHRFLCRAIYGEDRALRLAQTAPSGPRLQLRNRRALTGKDLQKAQPTNDSAAAACHSAASR